MSRSKMPFNNRVSSSTALKTNDMWSKTIGFDPYGPGDKDSSEDQAAQEHTASLLLLARMTKASGAETRGCCKRCGMLGHLTFQCRNAPMNAPKANDDSSSDDDDDDDDNDNDGNEGSSVEDKKNKKAIRGVNSDVKEAEVRKRKLDQNNSDDDDSNDSSTSNSSDSEKKKKKKKHSKKKKEKKEKKTKHKKKKHSKSKHAESSK